MKFSVNAFIMLAILFAVCNARYVYDEPERFALMQGKVTLVYHCFSCFKRLVMESEITYKSKAHFRLT